MQHIKKWRVSIDKISELKKTISEYKNMSRETPYYWTRQWVINNKPHLLSSYDDSLSAGQFESKEWMVNELKTFDWSNPTHIEIIGGWFGYPLIEMLQSFINIKQIDFYEIDPECKEVLAQHIVNFKPNFPIKMFGDFFSRKEKRRRDLVINTSSEHMDDIHKMSHFFVKTIYADVDIDHNFPIVAIQSTNYEDVHDHINCVYSIDELRYKCNFDKVLYEGSKKTQFYDRFMIIGNYRAIY